MKNITITTSLHLLSSRKKQTQPERAEKHNIYTLENGVENVPRYFQESRGGTTSFVENSFYSLFLSLSLSMGCLSLRKTRSIVLFDDVDDVLENNGVYIHTPLNRIQRIIRKRLYCVNLSQHMMRLQIKEDFVRIRALIAPSFSRYSEKN